MIWLATLVIAWDSDGVNKLKQSFAELSKILIILKWNFQILNVVIARVLSLD